MSSADGDYELMDSGDGRKLERFGRVSIVRPCAQALWAQSLPQAVWGAAAASFDRDEGNHWHGREALPPSWIVSAGGIRFKLAATDFGHLGVFPEQRAQWEWIRETVRAASARRAPESLSVLNLFAYSGGATLAAAQGGAEVCHLDASRGMVQWARENAALNGLGLAPVRWIVDDAHKFLAREVRRRRRYDAVILDPPTFGRGASGETYKFERDVRETLSYVREVLSDDPVFVLFSSHSPGVTPAVCRRLVGSFFPGAEISAGEMMLDARSPAAGVPSGVYARAVFPGAPGAAGAGGADG